MAKSKGANTSTDWAQYRNPEFLRTMLVGLAMDCPLDKDLCQCSLRFERVLSFDEKVDWARSLTNKEIVNLYSIHRQCFHSTV
jgi:hypothetical protein